MVSLLVVHFNKMPNSFFQFKKFKIEQDKSALKVCTDACLFGACIAKRGTTDHHPQTILDIGTGTGLLSLMIAQENEMASIEAVEIDKDSAQQAKENFEASPWKERFIIHNKSIQEFVSCSTQRFDLIISNPPFFENDLKSENDQKNLSKHDQSLKLDELVDCIDKLLKPEGSYWVLLPYHRTSYFMELVNGKGLFPGEVMLIRQTTQHGYFRSIITGQRTFTRNIRETSISIKGDDNEYTNEFAELLRGYYLYL